MNLLYDIQFAYNDWFVCWFVCAFLVVWGNPLIIRNKFSATEFFRDCYNYKATAAQYIAETSRFLLQTKESEWDKKHSVRVMFG